MGKSVSLSGAANLSSSAKEAFVGTRLVLTAPRTLAFVDEPDAPLGSKELRVKTLLSGISAGTELSSYRGTNPFLNKRWDTDRRVFVAQDTAPPNFPVK